MLFTVLSASFCRNSRRLHVSIVLARQERGNNQLFYLIRENRVGRSGVGSVFVLQPQWHSTESQESLNFKVDPRLRHAGAGGGHRATHRVIVSIIQIIETYLDMWYASNIYCQLSWLRAEVSWFVTVLLLFHLGTQYAVSNSGSFGTNSFIWLCNSNCL